MKKKLWLVLLGLVSALLCALVLAACSDGGAVSNSAGGGDDFTTHDWQYVNAKKPTCTEFGNISYFKCRDCGRLAVYEDDIELKDDEIFDEMLSAKFVSPDEVLLDPTGHRNTEEPDEYHAPTCTEQGWVAAFYCWDCGRYYDPTTMEEIPEAELWIPSLGGHVYGDYTIDGGIHFRTCTVCGDVEREFHEFGEYTATEEGCFGVCKCGETQLETHNYDDGTCTTCGYEHVAHTFQEFTIMEDEHTGTCDECGKTITGTHDFSAALAESEHLSEEATCRHPARYYYSCIVCGTNAPERTFESGDVAEHAFEREETEHLAEGADCTHPARYYCLCKWCDEYGTETFERGELGPHDFTAERAESQYLYEEATCTAAPRYYYSCTKCEERGSELFEYGQPNGHQFTEQKHESKYLKEEATCRHPAQYYYACSVCGECGTENGETFEFGERVGHAFERRENKYLAQEADCVNPARYYYLCKWCDETSSETFLWGYANGHTLGEWEISVKATYLGGMNGVKKKCCTVCGITIATSRYEICRECSGSGKVDCSTCRSVGYTEDDCRICRGRGVLLDRVTTTPCPQCGGRGCTSCFSTGYLCVTQRCVNCQGKGRVLSQCYSCSGTGKLRCSECKGAGDIVEDEIKPVTTEDDFVFYQKSGKYYLVGYLGCERVVTLPESYHGSQYIVIGSAFAKSRSFESMIITGGVLAIEANAFLDCALKTVYFYGTQEDWAGIRIEESGNDTLLNAERYFLSQETPTPEQWTESEYWWYYGDDGQPVIWKKQN